MPAAPAEFFTDPLSPWGWAAQPTLRRLRVEFDDLTLVPRTTVVLPDTSRSAWLPPNVEDASALPSVWRDVAASTGMPVTSTLWEDGVPTGSRDACAAVASVRETAPGSALPFLRRVREAVFVEGRRMDDAAELAAAARDVEGVDPDALRRALGDGRAAAALEDDLTRAVDVGSELPSVEVRGTVGTLPATPRLDPARAERDGEDGDAGDNEAGGGAANADGDGGDADGGAE
ncbi:MAG: DsbA family protein, partial [Salinigranum sp.]